MEWSEWYSLYEAAAAVQATEWLTMEDEHYADVVGADSLVNHEPYPAKLETRGAFYGI